jgi:hypothetical protein
MVLAVVRRCSRCFDGARGGSTVLGWCSGRCAESVGGVGSETVSSRSVPVFCPVCTLEVLDVAALALHLVAEAEQSDVAHVMWLNRHVTKCRVSPAALQVLLEGECSGDLSPGKRVAR